MFALGSLVKEGAFDLIVKFVFLHTSVFEKQVDVITEFFIFLAVVFEK